MEIIRLNTLVVGTGAAGYNAAIRLKKFGVDSVAIATEGVKIGTSRNTGSDKQTYYKLGMAGDMKDSVKDMASDLFAGGCVDGDNALVEAALSARCFLNLCELGVSFPTNRYGEYVGYKTDHDPYARATSVGPLTSKEMTEKLQAEAERQNIKVYDNTMIVSVIVDGGRAIGAVALNTVAKQTEFVLFNCTNIIFATGGPGGIYGDSVYPTCHNGSSGVLFECGVRGQSLTQWQYGLASVNPRWNVSGTYMQVLPRFVSVDENGDEHDFLEEYFSDEGEKLTNVFLKGYQWPFDSRKVLNGSSIIDILVYRERVMRNRRVYLDFMHNPEKKQSIDFSLLSGEAYEYLDKAGALFGTPIERLKHMNTPAIELYKNKGVNIEKEYLEIALCAQHNNGGASVDLWWQSNIKHLFVCGEAAGTHGIYRPGGSALNAGQIGSLRAAQYISARYKDEPIGDKEFEAIARFYLAYNNSLAESFARNENTVAAKLKEARKRMSDFGGAMREEKQIREAIRLTDNELKEIDNSLGGNLVQCYRLRDILICQKMYLYAMLNHIEHFAKTCGSALYYDNSGELREGLEEKFRFTLDEGRVKDYVQETSYGSVCTSTFRKVREMPENGGFFENVWRSFRENGNIE